MLKFKRSTEVMLKYSTNVSFKLLDIITAVSKRIEDLKIVRKEYFHALKDVPNDSL